MDKTVFIDFYNKQVDKIYRFIYFRVGSEETAQDLASEAFLKLWQSASGGGQNLSNRRVKVENPRALLYQIARNLVTDFYRQKPAFEAILTSDHPDFLEIPSQEDLMEKINRESELEQIKEAVKKIPAEQQEAVLLRYLDEMEVKEIAQILNKSEGAVRVLVHRGLESLKKVLGV